MTLFVPRPSTAACPPPPATSHRATHLRQLYTVLHLCLLRGDLVRARRAWTVLVGCRESSWEDLWRLGLGLNAVVGHGGADVEQQQREVDLRDGEYLESLMSGGERMSIPLLQAHVNHLLSRKPPQPEQALERLEIFLPGLPFAHSPALHALAGMCALMLSLEGRARGAPPNLSHNRQALSYIQKAITLLSSASSASQATAGGSSPSPASAPATENKTFYTSLLQLVHDTARWGVLEQAEMREGRGTKAERDSSEEGDTPPPPSSSGAPGAESEGDDDARPVIGGDWQQVKRERAAERQPSLFSTSDRRSRASSAGPADVPWASGQGDRAVQPPPAASEHEQMDGVEEGVSDLDDDGDGSYEMDDD